MFVFAAVFSVLVVAVAVAAPALAARLIYLHLVGVTARKSRMLAVLAEVLQKLSDTQLRLIVRRVKLPFHVCVFAENVLLRWLGLAAALQLWFFRPQPLRTVRTTLRITDALRTLPLMRTLLTLRLYRLLLRNRLHQANTWYPRLNQLRRLLTLFQAPRWLRRLSPSRCHPLACL